MEPTASRRTIQLCMSSFCQPTATRVLTRQLVLFSLGLVSATLVYRGLIAVRGCWIFAEWLFGWGVYSHLSLFNLNHPYAALTAEAIAIAFWLAILAGMWFF